MARWTTLPNISKQLAFLLAIAFTHAASIAAPITFTTSGKIVSGTAYQGAYSGGVSNRDLTGEAFIQSVTFDPIAVTPDFDSPPDYTFLSGRIYSGVVTSIVTIGDVSNSYVWDASKFLFAQVGLLNWLTKGDTTRFDGVVFRTFGLTGDYTSVDIGSNVYSNINAFQLGLDLAQNWSYKVQPGDMIQDAAVSILDPFGQIEMSYFGQPGMISMAVDTAIPEPSASALLALGLATLLIARRRQQVRRQD